MRNALSACLLAALLAAPVSAREVERQEVAEAFAEDVPQERRLYCRDTQVVTLADGREMRACIDWRAQNRTRVVRTYAALDGPETDQDANLDLARACFEIAVASQNDPYRTAFDADLFLAGARSHFDLCSRARGLARSGEYSLRLYETGVWLGGR
ncbi:hypothetical protein [Qipengyuania nanhaisediminis]|uniref:hypothetical protein n=1 Tax=Qipengyuania nanhaisediminis TaxID=604088 RepID=UPI0038B25E82